MTVETRDVVERAFKLALDELPKFVAAQGSGNAPDAVEALAVAKYRLGESDAAQALFASVPQGHAFHVRSLVLRMRLFFNAGDTDSALRAARLILDVEVDNREALRTAGRIYNSARDYDHADRFWRQLTEVAPDDNEAALQVARIAARRGAWESVALYAAMAQEARPGVEPMRLQMDAALKSPDAAAVTHEVLPALFAEDAEAGTRYLKILLGRDGGPAFAALAGRLAEAHPGDAELAQLAASTALRWTQEAQSAEVGRNDERAGRLYAAARALAADPRQANEGLARLSRSLVIDMRAALKDGRNDDADALALRLQELDAQNSEAPFVRGRLYLADRPEQAVPQFEHCVAIEPASGWYRLNLARALARAGRLIEAHDMFGSVLETDANTAYLEEAETQRDVIAKAMMRQGSTLYADGKFAEALEIFHKCRDFEEFGERAEKMYIACRRAMLLHLKELYAANDPSLIDAATPVTRHWPENVQIWQMLARALMAARRHAEALDAWEQLAELEPENAHYQLQIARCCSWLGKPEGADAARKAFELDPSLAEAQQLEERMRGLESSVA